MIGPGLELLWKHNDWDTVSSGFVTITRSVLEDWRMDGLDSGVPSLRRTHSDRVRVATIVQGNAKDDLERDFLNRPWPSHTPSFPPTTTVPQTLRSSQFE